MSGQNGGGVGVRLLQATVFVTGMSIMAIEMSASRLVAPFFGTSLIVWTNIIGLIMVALSLGYWYGGRLADRRPDAAVLYRLILGAGIATFVIPYVAGPVMSWTAQGSVGLFLGSLLAVMGLFVVPFTLLGMVSPFVIRLASSSVETVGAAAGSIYALSTAGSIIGTYLPALAFIPLLGTRRTILLFAAALVAVGIAGLFRSRKGSLAPARALAAVPLLALGLALVGPPGDVKAVFAPGRTKLFETESPYNYIQVQERSVPMASGKIRHRRLLVLNEGFAVHSVSDPDGPFHPFVGSVWDYFGLSVVPLTGKREGPMRVCLVGLAAGTISTQMISAYGGRFDLKIDGVEIDPEIIEVGRRFFRMNEPQLTAVAEDGRTFLQRTPTRYHAIVTDAYRQPYIPFHLTTQEYFRLCRDHLEPGGIVGINLGSTSDQTEVFRRLVGTMASVFPHVWYVPVGHDGALFTNYVVLASDRDVDPALLNPDDEALFGAVRATTAWPLARSVLQKARSGWTPFVPDPAEVVLTDDEAPVEFLTDWLIVRTLMSGSADAAIAAEMGTAKP